ncbi:MAG TPA: glycosyltransferase family 4 protein [Steroidobacteraceae bacterium]|nr:glycosyltransferase family 4 protein [Steroidobacteraceae bacterium]
MKIAQIAPLDESVPPQLYGGTERVVAHLCDALVDRGHEVTLFAAAGARTRAHQVSARDQPIRLDKSELKSELGAHLSMLHDVRERAGQFDILHFHTEMLHFPMFEQLAHKTVTTLHGRLDVKDLPGVYSRWPQFGLVSISNDQRRPLPHAHWLATVPHGLELDLYRFQERSRPGYLAFLGRISPEKGADAAIRIASKAGLPLKIAAKVDDADAVYFDSEIKPLLENQAVEFVGEIGDEQKSQFLGDALALLFPVDWPEPFGLVMIEAMACGTPTIAWQRGSVPEVIDEGVTGLIVNSIEEAVAAIPRVRQLDRQRIRATFERRFGAETMANAYLDVYNRLLASRPTAAP